MKALSCGRSSGAVSLALLLATAVPAAAGSPTPSNLYGTSVAEERQRQTLVKEGESLIKAGKPKEGLAKLERAIEVRSSPDVLLWAGFAQEQLGDLLEARKLYFQALDDARAEKLKLDEEHAGVALKALAPKVPRIVIHVPSDVEAEVQLDEARVEHAAEGIDLNPGPHVVVVKARGRQTYHAESVANIGGVEVLEVVLPKLPPPPAPPPPAPATKALSASKGPRTEAIVLGVIGGIGFITGTIVLVSGAEDGRSDKLTVGAMVAGGGLAIGLGGLIWGISSSRDGGPSAAQARRSGRRSARVPLDVWVSPSPKGIWTGVGGQL